MKKIIKEIKKNRDNYFFMLPYLLLFSIFTIIPVAISIALGFTYFNVIETPRFIGLDNYIKLFFDDSLFVKSFGNTLVISAITGPIGFLLCFFMAWLLNEFGPKFRSLLTLFLYAPSISGSVYLIFSIIYSGDAYGLLNAVLMEFNIIYEPVQWLTDSAFMLPTLIVVILWTSLGTGFLSFIAGLQNLDNKLYEAAAVDGIRNRFQELWYITLPQMKPQLLFGAVMSITSSFGVGDVITGLYGFPSTNYTLWTMVHHLQDYGSTRFEMGYASAIATILFVVMLFANSIIQRLLQKLGN